MPEAIEYQTSSMDEAISLFFEDAESGYIGISYKVFIDDSADQKQEKYVLAGALIGHKNSWHDFAKLWQKALDKPPAIRHFHTKEWAYLTGEFAQFRDTDKWPKSICRDVADAKRNSLLKVMESSHIGGVGIAILIPDYKKVRAEHPKANTYFNEDAFECALQETLLQAVKAVEKVDPKAKIGFISDLSDKSARYTEVFNGWKTRNPVSAKSMLGILHLNDEESPGLQAADICANQAKQALDRWSNTGDIVESDLQTSFYRIGYWNEARMLNILDAQTETPPEDGNENSTQNDFEV